MNWLRQACHGRGRARSRARAAIWARHCSKAAIDPTPKATAGNYHERLVASVSVFSPRFTGKAKVKTTGPVFLDRFKDRIQNGLLMGKPHWRSRYTVTRHTQQELTFLASNLPTAINSGLNDVNLSIAVDGGLEYSVTYRRWAAYVVGLGALLGIVFLLVFLLCHIEGQIDRYAFVADPVLNRTIGLALFWAAVLFWALIWPWILVLMHKLFGRKLLNRIIREVDYPAARPGCAEDAL